MSKELKHTKGPWAIEPHKEFINEYGVRVFSIGSKNCTEMVHVFGNDEEEEANAKLIASAPELLEALIEANEALKWFMSNTSPDNKNDYQSYHDTGMNAIQQAEDAINKATL